MNKITKYATEGYVDTSTADIIDPIKIQHVINISSNMIYKEILILESKVSDVLTYEKIAVDTKYPNYNSTVYFYFNINKTVKDITDLYDVHFELKYKVNNKTEIIGNRIDINHARLFSFKIEDGAMYNGTHTDRSNMSFRLYPNKRYDESYNLVDDESSCAFFMANKYISISNNDVNNLKNATISVHLRQRNYLSLDNTGEFNPTSEYHPATKKYIDDRLSLDLETVYAIPKEELDKANKASGTTCSKDLSLLNKSDMYYAIYEGNSFQMNYDSDYKRFYVSINNDITIYFKNDGTNKMGLFNTGLDAVKQYKFTGDLEIKVKKMLNVKEVATKKYVDDSTKDFIKEGRAGLGDKGKNSNAIGSGNTASGDISLATGWNTIASGNSSFTANSSTYASGDRSFAQGDDNYAEGEMSHAEGYSNHAVGRGSHVEGTGNYSMGEFSHVEGKYSIKDEEKKYAHIVGNGLGYNPNTREWEYSNAYTLDWSGNAWFAGCIQANNIPYVVGEKVVLTVPAATITAKKAEIDNATQENPVQITIDGTVTYDPTKSYYLKYNNIEYPTIINDEACLVSGEGCLFLIMPYGSSNVMAIMSLDTTNITDAQLIEKDIKKLDTMYLPNDLRVNNSITLGARTGTIGACSFSCGTACEASGIASHAEGFETIASDDGSHAEGEGTTASGPNSHAEGYNTTASGDNSHAEGDGTIASGPYSHAEGNATKASGTGSHAEGCYTNASGTGSHAEGNNTTALGTSSHVEGYGTTASGKYQHVQGKFNIEDAEGKYAHIVGNGSENNKANAYTLDWNGNGWYKGKLSQEGTPTDNKDLTNKKYVDDAITQADVVATDEEVKTMINSILGGDYVE